MKVNKYCNPSILDSTIERMPREPEESTSLYWVLVESHLMWTRNNQSSGSWEILICRTRPRVCSGTLHQRGSLSLVLITRGSCMKVLFQWVCVAVSTIHQVGVYSCCLLQSFLGLLLVGIQSIHPFILSLGSSKNSLLLLLLQIINQRIFIDHGDCQLGFQHHFGEPGASHETHRIARIVTTSHCE